MKLFMIEREVQGASELTHEQLAEISRTSNAAVDGPFSIAPEPRAKAPWLLIVDRKYLFAVAAAATARGA